MVNRLAEKRFIGRIWRFLHKEPMRPGHFRSVILMYHSVGESPDSVRTEQFKAQMLWLKSHARVVSLDELLRDRTDGNSQLRCVISFDDGYENLYTNVLPILDRLEFPAVAYIPAGIIGETVQHPPSDQKGLSRHEKMLSWSQVREVSARGVTIGSHSFEHLDLARLNEREAFGQLERSRILITERTGQTCRHFAYPWGSFNAETVRSVQKIGYESAVTVIHRGVGPTEDRLLLPRVNITAKHTLRDFQATVRGDWDFISWYQTLRNLVPASIIETPWHINHRT